MAKQTGTERVDVLLGDTSLLDVNDLLFGLGGNDEMAGLTGNDVLDGGDGNDFLVGNDGNDTLTGGNGGDFLGDLMREQSTPGAEFLVEPGDDILDGGEGADLISGGEGNDISWGGTGDDFMGSFRATTVRNLMPQATTRIGVEFGNDRLGGGDGHDLMSGGEGDDQLFGGNDADIMGNFLISLKDVNSNDKPQSSASRLPFFLQFDYKSLTYAADDGGNDSYDGGNGDDYLSGGEGDDQLLGNFGLDVMGAYTVKIRASSFNSASSSGHQTGFDPGNDRFDGGEGNDFLCGGEGDDVLQGGDGNDALGSFDLTRPADASNILLDAPGTFGSFERSISANDEAGDDSLEGGSGSDSLSG